MATRNNKPPLYIFGWPSFVGGADTKLAHLLPLLHREFDITAIPNDGGRLKEKVWTDLMDRLGIRYVVLGQLGRKLNGIALSLCNPHFFTAGLARRAKERGLKVIWSSEMTWHHRGELKAVKAGLVDKVLYVSEVQKERLSRGYGKLPSAMTGNYIDPNSFPFRPRRNATFAIGRLSRPAPEKYPDDLPAFYEALGLPETRFRVMAWDENVASKYRWHHFDGRWDLLPAMKETVPKFLYSLDLFVFPIGHNCVEAWGRSTVEAMLTGCIPLVPTGHHFEQLMVSGESGFICQDFRDYQGWANRLYHDYPWRQKVAQRCRTHAAQELCNPEKHRELWRAALT
jgi:hypothetical protein